MKASSRTLTGSLATVLTLGLWACGGSKQAAPGPGQTDAPGTAKPASEGAASKEAGKLGVVDLEIGRSLGPDKHVADRTLVFKPGEKIAFAVVADGSADKLEMLVELTDPRGRSIFNEKRVVSAPGGRNVVTTFELSGQPAFPGLRYAVRATVGSSSLVQEFEVK